MLPLLTSSALQKEKPWEKPLLINVSNVSNEIIGD